MSAIGPILVLEDDSDDQEILEDIFVFLNVPNSRIYFDSSDKFIAHLTSTREQPKIIIADINLAIQTGLEAKQIIESNIHLKTKTIPFVFLTTSSAPGEVLAAYQLNSQGYFVKPNTMPVMRELIRDILSYWGHSLHPNKLS